MFIYKQDKTMTFLSARKAFGTRALTGAAVALCCALPFAARAQDSDSAGRAGETRQPDPTPKKNSVPQGVDPKAKKTTTKASAKSAPKTKTSVKNTNAARRVALVFPVDAKGAAAEQLSDVITDVEKARLSATGQYGAVSFLTSLPSVRRAVGEQSLTSADVAPPFASRTKAQKLTTTAGYDLAVINSLDQYEYNPDTQNVSMVLSVQMIDFASSPPRSFTAAEPVTTAAKSAKNATDTTAAEEAARNLTEKLMTNVLNSAMGAKAAPAGAGGTGASPAGGAGAMKTTGKAK